MGLDLIAGVSARSALHGLASTAFSEANSAAEEGNTLTTQLGG